MTTSKKHKRLNIHLSKIGSIKVDAKEFFAHPDVKEKLRKMKEIDFVKDQSDTRNASKDDEGTE